MAILLVGQQINVNLRWHLFHRQPSCGRALVLPKGPALVQLSALVSHVAKSSKSMVYCSCSLAQGAPSQSKSIPSTAQLLSVLCFSFSSPCRPDQAIERENPPRHRIRDRGLFYHTGPSTSSSSKTSSLLSQVSNFHPLPCLSPHDKSSKERTPPPLCGEPRTKENSFLSIHGLRKAACRKVSKRASEALHGSSCFGGSRKKKSRGWD